MLPPRTYTYVVRRVAPELPRMCVCRMCARLWAQGLHQLHTNYGAVRTCAHVHTFVCALARLCSLIFFCFFGWHPHCSLFRTFITNFIIACSLHLFRIHELTNHTETIINAIVWSTTRCRPPTPSPTSSSLRSLLGFVCHGNGDADMPRSASVCSIGGYGHVWQSVSHRVAHVLENGLHVR